MVLWLIKNFSLFMLYTRNTNTRGNIIKHNLRTSMNERNTLLYKNISYTLYSRKGWCFCGVWEMDGETYILRERASSSHTFYREPGGANAFTPLQARQRRLWSTACPSLDCDSLHSVQIWPRGSHHVFFFRLHTCSA